MAILFLALIGVACASADRGMPTPATQSMGGTAIPSPIEKTENNTPTHPALQVPATPSPTQGSAPILSGGKYLFIEFWNHETGSGTLPMTAIDFPHYYFDPDNGTLSINASDSITLSTTDLGFIGIGTSLSEAAGMGAASGLTVIDLLPYSTKVYLYTRQADQQTVTHMEETREVTLTLLSAAQNGTISIELDGQTMTLASGKSWMQTVEKDIRDNQYNGHLILTSTLTNHGWQDRAKINKQ
jgi:hypothetical protein